MTGQKTKYCMLGYIYIYYWQFKYLYRFQIWQVLQQHSCLSNCWIIIRNLGALRAEILGIWDLTRSYVILKCFPQFGFVDKGRIPLWQKQAWMHIQKCSFLSRNFIPNCLQNTLLGHSTYIPQKIACIYKIFYSQVHTLSVQMTICTYVMSVMSQMLLAIYHACIWSQFLSHLIFWPNSQ